MLNSKTTLLEVAKPQFLKFTQFLMLTVMTYSTAVSANNHDYTQDTKTASKQNDGNLVIHHQHGQGQWMLGYKYVNSYMDGLIRGNADSEGDEKVTSQEISRALIGSDPLVPVSNFDYLMSPTDMTSQTHMLMAMYGYDDEISLMFMTHVVQKSMSMVMHVGDTNGITNTVNSNMQTTGIGNSLFTVTLNFNEHWSNSFGFSLPTGSINEKVIMNGVTVQAPYAMQLSSGTFDFLQSVTYSAVYGNFDWGAQENYTYRHGVNENGYVLGNRFEISAWARQMFTNQLSISARFNMFNQGSTEGRDAKILNPNLSPIFDSANSGSHQSNLSLGISKSFNERHSVGIEYTKPIMQEVNGIQLEAQYKIALSWSYQL